MTPKRILFIIGHAPRRGALAHETLDEILVGAAFDQRISVIFLGDGVYQLLDGATPDGIARSYRALPTYDVDAIFVDEAALVRRGLAIESLPLPVQPLKREAIRRLVAAQDVVVPD